MVKTKHSEIEEKKIKYWWGEVDINWAQVAATIGVEDSFVARQRMTFVDTTIIEGARWICVGGMDREYEFRCAIVGIHGLHI